jgi:hypothetical protein
MQTNSRFPTQTSLIAAALLLAILSCDDPEPTMFGKVNTMTVVIHNTKVYHLDEQSRIYYSYPDHNTKVYHLDEQSRIYYSYPDPMWTTGLVLSDREGTSNFGLIFSADTELVAGQIYQTSPEGEVTYDASQYVKGTDVGYVAENNSALDYGALSDQPLRLEIIEFELGEAIDSRKFAIKKMKAKATFPVRALLDRHGTAPALVTNATVLINIDR